MLEKKRKIKANLRFQASEQFDGTRWLIPKTMVVMLTPDKKFTNIEKVCKNFRDTKKLIPTKAKKHMTLLDGRSKRRSKTKKCLNQRNSTLGKRTAEEEVLETLRGETAKTGLGDGITKGYQALSGI